MLKKVFFLAVALALLALPALAQDAPPRLNVVDYDLCGDFGGVTVTVVGDAGHNLAPYHFWADDFAAMGITIEIIEVPFADVYQVLKTEFVAGSGAFDVVTFYPSYIGDFAGNGYLLPLDDLMAREPASVWDPNMDDVLAPFRELYNKWGGQTYALTIDGDVLVMMYRADLFSNEDEKAAFMEQYGRELRPPETWSEWLEVAEFFTRDAGETLAGEVLTQPFYGTAEFGRRGFSYAWYLNRAASNGVMLFDEQMNPGINSPEAVAALQNMIDTLKFAPPDVLNFGYDELRDAFIGGQLAMVVQWTDVPKKAADPSISRIAGKVGVGRVPGFEVGGEVAHRSMMPVGRVVGVAADSDVPEAAYCVAKHIAYNTSLENVSTSLTGLDPYRMLHLTHPEAFAPLMGQENAEAYLAGLQVALADGYPDLFIPGAAQYQDALDIQVNRALAGEVSAQEALDAVAAAWNEITDRLGRDTQVAFWQQALESYRALGLVK
ncbi:MAG: sugar ABC transporter substrate-binding protein [Chloroflexi bacterium]|nr:sugar ABC transporter substrate-binding protein [Chloroflexota bacterium]MDL1882316.1 sugar ABC transporter substrate-binding protein [Anaerolineae bacterium CFX8]